MQCLIDAINAANFNGQANTIHLDASTYSLTRTDNGTPGVGNGLPVIVGQITIAGVGKNATAIEGPNIFPGDFFPPFRILEVAATGVLALDHLTVRRGGFGTNFMTAGGILSTGALTIRDSAIINNRGVEGSAIVVKSGTLTMTDTLVARNEGLYESASIVIGRFNPASARIERTLVADNFNELGFGILVSDGATATVTDSAVVRNVTGGVFSGGIGIVGGNVLLTNVTVAGHHADLATGVLAESGASVSIVHSTIADNSTNVSGNVQIENSIVAGNRFGNCASAITSLGHNLFEGLTGCGALTPDDQTVAAGAARLGTLIDTGITAYVPLLADSPAIDFADSKACPPADQRELHRPIDGNGDGRRACDAGAIEFYPVVNDLLQLDAIDSKYVPPSEPSNPLAAGGEFHINGTFTNIDPRDICHVAFDVITLNGAASPVVLTQGGLLIGGQGSAATAAAAGAPADLASQAQQQYHFRIGVPQAEGISFFVNMLGEATAGPCDP